MFFGSGPLQLRRKSPGAASRRVKISTRTARFYQGKEFRLCNRTVDSVGHQEGLEI